MSKFNKALRLILENEKVTIIEQTEEIDEESGASVIAWAETGELFCNIQEKIRDNGGGNTLTNTAQGDILSTERNLYTQTEIAEGERIKRADGSLYELCNVCHNGQKTILEHYQARLVRINQ